MEFPMPERVTLSKESFLSRYLSGDHDVSLHSAFVSFRDMLALPTPRPLLRNAATAPPVFSDKNPPVPKSVSVVSRMVDISESRRQGMVHILWKLVSTGFCRDERELERLWKAKGPKDVGDGGFLGVALWAGQTEKQIFDKSRHDLSDYNSLLLNLVMGLLRKKDWLGKTLPQSHLTNCATQTKDSFVQQRQRSTEEILKAKKSKYLTKQELAALREQNRVLERKARRRRRLQLCHSFTQTSASLQDGFKSMESESSAAFSWLELAPVPVRFFPMHWAATQTDHREISATKKITAKEEMTLKALLCVRKRLDPFLCHFIQKWTVFAAGNAPSKEATLGLRMARFVQLLLQLPNMELGRCPNHQRRPSIKADCLFCEAAIKAPPPWADVMFQLQCELVTGLFIGNPTDKTHFPIQCGMEKEEGPLLGALPPWSLLLHLLRQHMFDYMIGLAKSGWNLDRKGVQTKLMDCGCLVPQMLGKMTQSDWENLEHWCLISDKELTHLCLRCGQFESTGKFLVCSWCQRQRLFAKAHYCSVDCLLKDWHNHHRLHEALAPGKIPTSAMMLFS